jgi:hypothetical protein
MKTIRTFGNVAEAGFAQSLLVAAGIDASLADEYAATLGAPFVTWGMRLQVPEEDEERALEILEGEGDPEWEPPHVISDETAPMEHEVTARDNAGTGSPGITCPSCRTGWELEKHELAQPTFTCTECGTVIPLRESEAAAKQSGGFDWHCFLPRSESKWVFILVMVAYAYILQRIVQDTLEPFTGTNQWMAYVIGWGRVLSHVAEAVVFAPIWETLLLVAIIELLRGLGISAIRQVLVSTAALGVVDGINWWPHGIFVIPFFAICGISYLYWRPTSWRIAIGIVILIHALSNCMPSIWLICTQMERDRISLHSTGYAYNWDQADELYTESGKDLSQNSTSAAIAALQQAIELYQYDSRYYLRLGRAYQVAGHLKEAESAFRQAIGIDQNDWESWDYLATVLYAEKRFPQALDADHRALMSAPPYAQPGIESWIREITLSLTGTSP